ncbi:MAG: ArsC family reductase [Gammaproteobacteria bacterium]|nr:MAG: ArsC family reductase [Gammaproteobacteria bacterium]
MWEGVIHLYGITNCDTVRKARKHLEQHAIPYCFHDFRKEGIDQERLTAWVEELGWEALLNRRGRSWRMLPEAQREDLDRERAIALMLANPTLIRRPVIETADQVAVGLDALPELVHG